MIIIKNNPNYIILLAFSERTQDLTKFFFLPKIVTTSRATSAAITSAGNAWESSEMVPMATAQVIRVTNATITSKKTPR